MANYFATKTAQFKPFSYQEMLAPIKAYQDAYNALETEMSNLDILANSIKNKLNPNDPEDAKKLKEYEAFQSEMDSAMDNFYNNGYNSDTRKKLNALKTLYAEKLDPINQAYERRIKDADFIRQHRITNPNLIVEGVGNSTSAYMYGNTPAPTVVNLNSVSDAAKNASAGLSKQFIEQIGLQNVEGYIGQYLMSGVKKGITSNMVSEFTKYVDAIKKDQTGELKTPQGMALYNMFEQIRTANNYDKLSQSGKDRLDASIIQGLVSGAAADEDIKYMADNYWNVENEKLKNKLNKAKLDAARNPKKDDSDLDLRTNTGVYKGKNYDVSVIADTLNVEFEPKKYNGNVITNGLVAYNIIHAKDVEIAKAQAEWDKLYEAKKEQWKGKVRPADEYGTPLTIEEILLRDDAGKEAYNRLSALQNEKAILRRDIGDISMKDEEIDRIRAYTFERANSTLNLIENAFKNSNVVIKDERGKVISLNGADEKSIVYVNGKKDESLTKDISLYKELQSFIKSSKIGPVTHKDLEMFATMMDSDLSTGVMAEKSVVIFDNNNSKEGLTDLVGTLSSNIIPILAKGNKVNITNSEGKKVKSRYFKSIIDSETGAIDAEKIEKAELDFNSADRKAIKLTAKDGKVFYIDSSYLIDQANAFIGGTTGIGNYYTELMSDYRSSKTAKAKSLNEALSSAAKSIQSAFDLNRNQSQSYTISNKDLKKLLAILDTDELL